MPIDIQVYMDALLKGLLREFGCELVYLGLQGSYLRGEATEQSDIDAMVVLEPFCPRSLTRYRSVVEALPHANRACGFICGKADLAGWNRGECAHLQCSTKDVYGSLSPLLPAFTAQDTLAYVKLNAGNIYHALCHSRIHASPERNSEALPVLYRGVFYVLQDLHFCRTGDIVVSKAALIPLLTGIEREALQTAMTIAGGEAYDFDAAFSLLFRWCGHILSL